MATNWPSGAALPRPRKRNKRPARRAAREQARLDLLARQVAADGLKYVPLALRGIKPLPEPADALRCEKCDCAMATIPGRGVVHVCPPATVDPHPTIPTHYAVDGGGPDARRK